MADVTVKLTLGSFSAEVSGPEEYVNAKFEALIERFLGSARSLATEARSPSSLSPETIEQGGKKLSPGEFLKMAGPKNQSEVAMLLGYYLERIRAMSGFTSTELGSLGREVKRPFGNPSDVVAKLTARGLMMSAGDKEGQRVYALTASGEEYVESIIELKKK
jgi:hypothetical protein